MNSIADSGDFRFSDGVIRGMVNGDVIATGCELLKMKAGLRALPVDENKVPFGWLTPRGVRDATDDPAILQQLLVLAGAHDGYASFAVVLGPRFVIPDDDTGTMDVGMYGPRDTFTEQTRRGLHPWFMLPDGRTLRKSRLLNGAGVIITGDRSYVLMSPSPNYRPIDFMAPVRRLPDDSPLWTIAAPDSTPDASFLTVTPEDEVEAQRVVEQLPFSTKYAPTLALLIAGKWEEAGYVSRSESDAALAFMASHFLRDNSRRAEILTAILRRYSTKAASHATPDKYLQYVVSSVIQHRDMKDETRIQTLDTMLQIVALTTISRQGVTDTKKDGKKGKGVLVEESIWAIATVIDAGIFWDSNAVRGGRKVSELIDQGWRRVPVEDLAALHGAHPEKVRLALKAMELRGVIERLVIPYHHDGKWRRDSLVRLVRR